MNNIFKALIAGYGAKKLGGGCFSTILVFVLIWILLEQCGAKPAVTGNAYENSPCIATLSVSDKTAAGNNAAPESYRQNSSNSAKRRSMLQGVPLVDSRENKSMKEAGIQQSE